MTTTATRPTDPVKPHDYPPRMSVRMGDALVEALEGGPSYLYRHAVTTIDALIGRQLLEGGVDGNYRLTERGSRAAAYTVAGRAYDAFWAARTEGTLARELAYCGPTSHRYGEMIPVGTRVFEVRPSGDTGIRCIVAGSGHWHLEYAAVTFAADQVQA